MTKQLYPYLMAVLLLAGACNKSETATEAVQELTLTPNATTQAQAPTSKAGGPELSGTSLGTDNSFVVYLSASNAQTGRYLTGQLFSYTPAGKWEASSAPGVADPVYWPTGGQALDFLGLACPPAAQTDLAPSWNEADPTNSVSISSWDTHAHQYDVLYAAANNQTSRTNNGIVPMQFRHAQALLCFTAVCDMADIFTLNGITINGLEYSGDFTVDNTLTSLSAKWSALTAGDKAVYALDGTDSDFNFTVPKTAATPCAQNILVPEQAAKSLTITYTLRGASTPLTYTIDLPRTIWKAGYKYTYAFDFSLTEILVQPSVTVWGNLTVNETFPNS